MGDLVHTPGDVAELAALVAERAAAGARLEVRGGATKAGVGAPRTAEVVDMRRFRGVADYDPAELVLTVAAGTPLAEVDQLLASSDQMLAFEPHDLGDVLGAARGSTIGGVVAAAVCGSRRVSRGAARDHLLGFRAVCGRGEVFVGGAKVVKNVTGYDLPKLAAGSWGRLFALTEVTLKVVPKPEATLTLAAPGLSLGAAVALMGRALGSPTEVAAAAHDPDRGGLTAIRLEGFAASVAARTERLRRLLADEGAWAAMDPSEADGFWSGLNHVQGFPPELPLWRISAPASRSVALIEALGPRSGVWRMDWGGGLLWLASPLAAQAVRAAAAGGGGHATLYRASEALRRTTPVFHPPAAGVMGLEARVRRAFDPAGVFDTGRFLEGRRAD